MSKVIQYDNEAKNSVIKGIDAVANIVKTTVGPKGRNVLIRNNLDIPVITNDGVTIAKSIQLKDNAEDAGASLIISAAKKTNDIAGDGTTTTTILAQEMIHKYYDLADENNNAVQTQKEMIKASEEISNYIKEIAKPASDNASIKRVATVSSGSEEIGNMIAEAFKTAGQYGSVIVENSKTGIDNLVSIQGMKLSTGSVSNYLLTDRANMKSQILDANVLITKDKIDSVSDILPILDYAVKNNLKLFIMCDDIDFEPLNMIILNRAQGAPLNVSITRLPGFGELRESLIEDICLATGATLMGRDVGITLKDFTPQYLGEADEITVTMDDVVIKFKDSTTTGLNLLQQRTDRVNELQSILSTVSTEQQDQYKRRISNLTSGISIIEVGGNSEVEIKDKKLRIEDALNSVTAAKEEGIVPGGGYSFLSAYMKVAEENKQRSTGEIVVYEALKAVTKQIAENSGVDGELVLANCFNKKLGYNALTDQYEDLMESGVINAAKVDRYALINAASIASTVITMGGLIVEENEKDQNVLQLAGPAQLTGIL